MPLGNEQQVLVEENMGLVGRVIKDSIHGVNRLGMYTYDDIFQIGCIGLIKAAMHFRQGNTKFGIYAYTVIRNEIYDALSYAAARERHECEAGPDGAAMLAKPTWDEYSLAAAELWHMLDAAKAGSGRAVAGGIEAIRMMADGYTAREIGEMMGGIPASNITAWVSKARKRLRSNPAVLALR